MRIRLVILLALLGLTSAGCSKDEPENAPRPRAAASQSSEAPPVTPDPAAPPQQGSPGAPGTPAAPADPNAPAIAGATGTVQGTRTMEEVGMAIEAAIAAAAALPANGDDTCTISYRGLEAMVDQLHRTMPEQPTNPLPPRDGYIELCRELPREVQQCLVIAHAVEHQAECEQATNDMDPALRARVEAMMNSGMPQAPAAPAAP